MAAIETTQYRMIATFYAHEHFRQAGHSMQTAGRLRRPGQRIRVSRGRHIAIRTRAQRRRGRRLRYRLQLLAR